MAGLLDFLNTPAGMGLLSSVAGYAAGARRGTPVNNVGRGLVTGLQGYQNANEQIRLDKENAFGQQYKQMQMDEMRGKITDQTAMRDAAAQAFQASRTPAQAAQPAMFGVGGNQGSEDAMGMVASQNRDINAMSEMPQLPEQVQQTQAPQAASPGGFDPVAYRQNMFAQMAGSGNPAEAMKYAPSPQKYGEIKFSGDGRAYMQADDGSIKWVNDVTPRDKLVTDNLGGKQVYRTEYSAYPVATAERTATPDSVMSNERAISEGRLNRGVTIRGQDAASANAAAARAVTIRGQDKPPQAARGGPMSVTLQKELLESDDVAQASKSVIGTLDAALKINKTAYSGYGAKSRAVARSNLPGESAAANATINIDNMMTGQALESLKVIFGGMPTEGERKILMEMQASVDKTPTQRAAIMERAKTAAKRRGEYSAGKAGAIRNGTYLTTGVPSQPSAPAGQDSPKKAPMKGQIVDGYKFKGGNPSDAANWEKSK